MPNRRTPRPMLATRPKRTGKPELRDYASYKSPGKRPSLDFDWDTALYLHAVSMAELGYELSPAQKKRIKDNA